MTTMRAPEGASFKFNQQNLNAFKRMGIEPDNLMPEFVLQNMMAFRNERYLHRRKCDFSGEEIISAYRPDTPFPVYRNDIWWGDAWDPMDYGVDYNFSKPFFQQFADLQKRVPREGTSVFNSENCDYNSHTRNSRNCYLSSLVFSCEDTHHSYWMVGTKDVSDCYFVTNSTLAYECIDCDNLYNCVHLQDCTNCNDCFFSYQLVGCKNCIACSNLSHKEYYVLNKPVSKKEFEHLRDEIISGTHAGWDKGVELFAKMWAVAKHRHLHNLKSESVVGDHLINSKNCSLCFDSTEIEDCAFTISGSESKDIYYSYSAGWPRCELVYNSLVTRGSTDIAFCYYTFHSSGLRYCDSSNSCQDCFGSIGLRHKKNCILNKQYSESEYQELVGKIVAQMKKTGEWGQFFPAELSTFPYNESAAQDYFPLTKEEILDRGWRWYERPAKDISGEAVPASAIAELSADIAKKNFLCQQSGQAFRVSSPELKFYKKMNVPLPRLSPESRFKERLSKRNKFEIYTRKCDISGDEILSSFPPGTNLTVVSEGEYLSSVL